MIQLAISYGVTNTVNAFAPTPTAGALRNNDITSAIMKPLQMAATLNTKPEEKELTEAELADAAAKQAYMEDSNTDDEDAKRAAMFVELGIAEDELALGIDPVKLVKYAKT